MPTHFLKFGVGSFSFDWDIVTVSICIASCKHLIVNNSRIFRPNKILLITLDQVSLKSVCAKFWADQTKFLGGVRKSRFFSFCDFTRRKWHPQIFGTQPTWFIWTQGICRYKVFECATFSLGVTGQNAFFLLQRPLLADMCNFLRLRWVRGSEPTHQRASPTDARFSPPNHFYAEKNNNNNNN